METDDDGASGTRWIQARNQMKTGGTTLMWAAVIATVALNLDPAWQKVFLDIVWFPLVIVFGLGLLMYGPVAWILKLFHIIFVAPPPKPAVVAKEIAKPSRMRWSIGLTSAVGVLAAIVAGWLGGTEFGVVVAVCAAVASAIVAVRTVG